MLLKQLRMKKKNKKVDLVILAASLLASAIIFKGVIRGSDGVIWAGEGVIRAGQDF